MPVLSNFTEALETFFDRGLIEDVLYEVKSGKEATVYCCRAGRDADAELVAAKIYRPTTRRRFKNDSLYQDGRVILDARARRAVKSKTDFGHEAKFGLWVNHEVEMLRALHRAGGAVPRLLAHSGSAILTEFLGDADCPAPQLHSVRLDPDEALGLFEVVMRNVELFLAHDVIHADLSAFNILYWDGAVTIIDFPQAVDPRFNRSAFNLLAHDVEHVCRYFARQGVASDPAAITIDLWTRFVNAQL